MKKIEKNIASLVWVLLWFCFSLTAANPGFGAEPDEEKLLNRLKGELAKEDSTMGKLLDRFSFGLLIESGAAYRSDNADGEDESDFALTTVELGIEAIINDWVTGEVVFLYEDPTFDDADSSFDVDIGTITVGDTEQFPLYATAGKFYMPYGAILTHFPDDPLIDLPVTLTFGEISERALQVGAEFGGFHIAGYAFNGSVEEVDEDENMIDSYG
jgi:hypothetical protein